MEERIRKRIAELTKARDSYLIGANREVAAFNAAIGELEALLKPEEKEARAEQSEAASSESSAGAVQAELQKMAGGE